MKCSCRNILWVLTILFGFAACKQKNIDTISSSISPKDSSLIFSLFDSAQNMQATDADSAFRLIKEAGEIATRIDYGEGIMNYYNYALYNKISFKNDVEAGKQYADSAMRYALMPGHEAYMTSANFTSAIYYQFIEKQDSAIKYYLKSLEYQPLTKDSSKLEPTYNNLAILLNYQGRYLQAIEYQKKSLRLYSTSDTNSLIGYYNNMYRHYIGAKDTNAAAEALHSSLSLSQMKLKWPAENEMLQIAGDYYLMIHKVDTAIFYYQHHLNFTASLYDSVYLSQPYVSLAKAYLADSNFQAATDYLKLSKALLNPQELPLFSQLDYYTIAYQLSLHDKDQTAALSALQQLNNVNENFILKQKNDAIVNYELQVKTLENEKSHLAASLKIKNKNIWILLLSMSSLLLLAAGIILTLYWRKNKIAAAAKLSKIELEAEWQQLQSRMQAQAEERNRISRELHDDLGATLTSISLAASLLQDNNQSQEVDIIARSSSDMATRMNEIVWSLNADNDNMQSLCAYIRKFCNTFLKEAGIAVQYTEDIADPSVEIKGSIRRNVFHTVKEAINNIVKHAQASKVQVNISADHNNFYIRIADNGMGMKDAKTNTWNNGLRNMQKNMESIKGSIQWIFKEGTEIFITTPLKL